MRQNYGYNAFSKDELIAEIRLLTHQRDEALRELARAPEPPAETSEQADRQLTRWEISSGRLTLDEAFGDVPPATILPESEDESSSDTL